MSVGEQLAAGAGTGPDGVQRHQSFLVYDNFRWLKICFAIILASILLYILDEPYGPRYGGTWAGYILGIAGAGLIFWLTWFGYRKRSYIDLHGRLVSRLSAHVYLGLALIVVATLHTGFSFGWNVHTLAYVLMCLVIASGVFGIFSYVRYPRLMTENRANLATHEMLSRIAGINDELRNAAVPLDDATALVVERAVESTAIGGSPWRQISGNYPGCATEAALAGVTAAEAKVPPELEDAYRRVHLLLDDKRALLRQIRTDISYKAMMDVWLYVHVPVTFALLAALVAHILSVLFFIPLAIRG
jgi:hypothetical protein